MLKSLWNSRYVAAYVCDLQGRVLHVNDAACGLLGCARAALLSKPLYDVVANSSYLYDEHQRLLSYAKAEKTTIELVKIMSSSDLVHTSDPLSLWRVATDEVAEAEVTLELRTPRGTLSVDAEVSCQQTSNGEVFLVHVLPVPASQPNTITPPQPATSPIPTPITTPTPAPTPTAITSNITSDYHASLRPWLASMPEVFDSLLPGAIVIVDRDGVYHDIKNAPDCITQVPIEQAIGKTFEEVLPAHLAAERRKAIEHVFASKKPYQFVSSQMTPEGVRYFDVCYSYLDEQFSVGVKYDITEKQQLERRLVASQSRAQALLAAIPDGVLTISREGVFLHVQPPKDFQFEHPASAFVGKHLDDVPEAADMREAIRHYVAQTLDTQKQHTHSYDITIDGKTHYRDMRFSYFDEDTCLILVRDVSEWMDTALALQGVQARFDQFMRITDDIFTVLDLTEKTLLYINPSYERLTGYNPNVMFADLTNMRFLDTIDSRDHHKIHMMYDALGKRHDSSFEYRLLCRDGSTRWMFLRCKVVLGGKTAVCMHTDISELKRSQDNLAVSRDQLRNVYDALPDAIARLNHKGEYISVKMPSYFASIASRAELLGSRIEDTLPADTAATLRKHFERTLEHGVMQVCHYDVPYQGEIVSREVRFTHELHLYLSIRRDCPRMASKGIRLTSNRSS